MMTEFKKRKTKYKPEYCDDLIKYMNKGYSNLELAAKFSIAEKTFYAWLKDYEDFQEAFDIGDPQRFAYMMQKADEAFMEKQNDKGYRYWKDKIRYTYKSYAPEAKDTGTTNISIGNVNMLQYQDKSPEQLYEILQTKISHLKPVEPTLIEKAQEFTEGVVIDMEKPLDD